MKCVKNSKEIKRVTDSKAEEMIKQGWIYCKKSDYKTYRKGKPEVVEAVVTEPVIEVVVPKVKKEKKFKTDKKRKSKENKENKEKAEEKEEKVEEKKA